MNPEITKKSSKPSTVLLLAVVLSLPACAGSPLEETHLNGDDIEASEHPLTFTSYDDAAGPVHMHVVACRGDQGLPAQTIACSVDPEWALVGGGAFAEQAGTGALLTESRPVDGLTWQASSTDDVTHSPHYLNVYAVGMRLDGVNSAYLRQMISQFSATSGQGATPSYSYNMGPGILSGGALGNVVSGGTELLTKSASSSSSAWDVASRKDLGGSQGTVTDYVTYWNQYHRIVEGFGALASKQKSGSKVTVSSGTAKATVGIDSGWVASGYGGAATTTSGDGRMLFRMGPDGNARSISVWSRDHSGHNSKGDTTAYVSEVQYISGTHGVCNTGAKLPRGTYQCVDSVCASKSSCCDTSWTKDCVALVDQLCNLVDSCDAYTCSQPPPWTTTTDTYWNTGAVHELNNCYNYATNTQTGTGSGHCAQPGFGSGSCSDDSACGNLWWYDRVNGPSKLIELVKGDGLIWRDQTASCPSSYMDLLALVLEPEQDVMQGWADYHWFRKDSDNKWSQKVSCNGKATNLDDNGQLITDPKKAGSLAGYTYWVGYFCACSDSRDGQGHSMIW